MNESNTQVKLVYTRNERHLNTVDELVDYLNENY